MMIASGSPLNKREETTGIMILYDDNLSRTRDTTFNDTSLRISLAAKRGKVSVRPRGWVVGGPQLFGRQFILLTVVHATRSKRLSSPDITTSGTFPTLATTGEGN